LTEHARPEEVRQSNHSKAHAATAQKIAAGEKAIREPRLVMRDDHFDRAKLDGASIECFSFWTQGSSDKFIF
jgi:hypothetical protein